jgi:hypothetical protein
VDLVRGEGLADLPDPTTAVVVSARKAAIEDRQMR